MLLFRNAGKGVVAVDETPVMMWCTIIVIGPILSGNRRVEI
jgi:hypothetical protein